MLIIISLIAMYYTSLKDIHPRYVQGFTSDKLSDWRSQDGIKNEKGARRVPCRDARRTRFKIMLSTQEPTRTVLGLQSPLLIGQTKFELRPDTKTILITGGAGFIASYVSRHFVCQYPEYMIVVFDKLDYCASLNNLESLKTHPNFVFEQGDITDADRVMAVLNAYKVDTIMHFAAQSHVDLSFGNSFSFTKNNVIGTHVLLECAKTAQIKLFLHVSTDEVYGEVSPTDPDLLETAILCPTNPYSASKAAAEMLVNAYSKSFKLPVMIVRSNNVYGPHQFPEKVIPKFVSLLKRGRKMILHGDGSPTRKYLFGSDAAEAFDTIFHKGIEGEIYNIGSYEEVQTRISVIFYWNNLEFQRSHLVIGLNSQRIVLSMI